MRRVADFELRKANPIEAQAFRGARDRCKLGTNYQNRGIEFRFTSFKQWFKELGKRPSKKHSVDRIDNDGHYEPGNVRWATRSEQQYNRRPDSAITLRKKSAKMKRQWREHRDAMMAALVSGRKKLDAATKRSWTPERRKTFGQAARKRMRLLWSDPVWRKRQLKACRKGRGI